MAMSGNKQRRFTDEFKREAVRLTMTSGRGRSKRQDFKVRRHARSYSIVRGCCRDSNAAQESLEREGFGKEGLDADGEDVHSFIGIEKVHADELGYLPL
jgi:transposase-like protein